MLPIALLLALFLPAQTGQVATLPAPSSTTAAKNAGEPYPLGGEVTAPVKISTPYPQYTKEALENGITGVVLLAVQVERDGTLSHVRVTQGLGHGLDEAAVAAVLRWRFHPATRNGEPVAVRTAVKVHFRIEDS